MIKKNWVLKRKKNEFYLKAKKYGYRSRSVFKLIEIQNKYKIFKNGIKVVDFGSSPGGWSELVVEYIGDNGYILSIDRFIIENILGVDFINGNINNKKFINSIINKLNNLIIDVIISDISPNVTGNKVIDIYNVIYLAKIILNFSKKKLKHHGCFLIKLFYGERFDFYINVLKNYFMNIYIIKPKSSILSSSEVYVFGKDFSII
ncbi:MAG: RlmE family RNA methyltransferase [Candidatus Azosocius agrarius]|nr:MAG: RlmE family RNA methyltransferase [Gammaproteobacteria bacterium]